MGEFYYTVILMRDAKFLLGAYEQMSVVLFTLHFLGIFFLACHIVLQCPKLAWQL